MEAPSRSRCSDSETVRGRITRWLMHHREKLRAPVLEIGSRLPSMACTWAVNRHLCSGTWVGMDAQEGSNVDVVSDCQPIPARDGAFGGAVASEVLEHCENPTGVLREIVRVLKPGAWCLISIPFAFPWHPHPVDYWRMTAQGLQFCCERAGFDCVNVSDAGRVQAQYRNHDGSDVLRTGLPIHIFAAARTPRDNAHGGATSRGSTT